MLRIQHSVTVPRPPERVWAVFQDLPGWPKWNPATPSATWLTEGQWRRGARMQLTLRLKGRRMTVRSEVVTIEPNRRVTWVGRRLGVVERHSFTFEADGDGTRVTTVETFSGPLLFLVRLLMSPTRLQAMLVQWLEALRAKAQR